MADDSPGILTVGWEFQSQTDIDAWEDQLDDEVLRWKRQERRWQFEQLWTSLPGPDTWRRVR